MRDLAVFEDLTQAQRDQAEKSLAIWNLWTKGEQRKLLTAWKANSWYGCRVSRALVAFLEG